MKKTFAALVILLVAIGVASAQPWGGPKGMKGKGFNFFVQRSWVPAQTLPQMEKITLEGTLELVNARVAIKKDAKTYYVAIPSRLYGFIDGLKEGANVTIEGYTHEVPGVKDSYMVRPDKLTLAGKTIELGNAMGGNAPMSGMMGGRMMGGGMMKGMRQGKGPMGKWSR